MRRFWSRKQKEEETSNASSTQTSKYSTICGANSKWRTGRLRELLLRLEPTLGFTMKIVERTGASLRSHFPLYNLWEGAACGRGECIPCAQEVEFKQPCTTNSMVYENVCVSCNPGTGGKRELESLVTTIPTAYVGETSRSIMERTKEHWSSYRSKHKESHLLKHQEL